MANITLFLAATGVKVPVVEIDLKLVTNRELLEAAFLEGVLDDEIKEFSSRHFGSKDSQHVKDVFRSSLYLVGKNQVCVCDEATLSSLGFVDGDTIKVVARLCC